MATTTIRNGVDLDRLVQTIEAIKGDAGVAGFTFRSTTTWQYELEALSFGVEGDLDLRNFVGIEQGPRPGFTAVRVRGRAKARNASPEQLDELCRYVQKTSPVGDIIANPVPIQVSLTAG
jgi:hypothetical protein